MSEAGAETGDSFEALLATIAARLLGEPAGSFDACIADAQSRLIQFLEVDRSMFGLVDPADGVLRTTHAAAAPGLVPFPVERSITDDTPWIFRQLTEKRVPVVISSPSDLPPEATVDAATYRAFAAKSVAIFPIVAGDQLLGAISFGTTQKERPWPPPLIERLPWIYNPAGRLVTIPDRLFALNGETYNDHSYYLLYLLDQQPAVLGARYRYFIVRFNSKREPEDIIPAGEAELPEN